MKHPARCLKLKCVLQVRSIVLPQLEKLSLDDKIFRHVTAGIDQAASSSGSGSSADASGVSTEGSVISDGETSSLDDSTPQETFLEVIATPDRGLAVLTTRKVKAGTLILAERPLISLDKHEEDDPSAIERAFTGLSRPDQKLYLRLFDAEKSRMTRVVSIYYSNCYNCDNFRTDTGHDSGSSNTNIGVGGSAIGLLASRINHSCIPNVQFSYDAHRHEMRFHAIRDIPRAKEVLSNYDKNIFLGAAARRRKQQIYYGFVCACEACRPPRTDFWARSDDRRTAMYEAFRAVQACDRRYARGGLESSPGPDPALGSSFGLGFDENAREKRALANEALDTLARLEGLLLKEGLLGVPLANIYRSMAKWAERVGEMSDARRCKFKEREVCLAALGGDAQRTREIGRKLADWDEILSRRTRE